MTTALALPATDLDALRVRVRFLADDRPGIYRMIDPAGRVLYVGKAKRLRTRLLSYFRARFPEDKAARILHAAHDIQWDPAPSEFAAYLAELRAIQRHRPPFNWHMNRKRKAAFVIMSTGPAPRLGLSHRTEGDGVLRYGPLLSPGLAQEAIRTLNDLLGLRDCAEKMPMVFADQGDLFREPQRAACMRHEFGTCTGPCAGLVSAIDYARQAETAIAFLEGRTIQPLDRVVREMTAASARGEFEAAVRWRERFEHLEWLMAALTRARAAIDLLTFVYRDPGAGGEERAYLIRRGLVRATFPWPASPIEQEAFAAVVRDELRRTEATHGPLPAATIDERLLLMRWFRQHPEALARTEPLERWAAA